MQLDGYIRVSQVRGRKGERFISPTVQREEIGRWIASNGAVLGEIFEELDQSGGRPDRPLLMEAIERVERGQSDGIVVAKLNRFGRSLIDGLRMIERIQKAGGTLVSVQQGFDLRTSTGQLVANILFAVAEWELDQWRQSWDDARRKRIERGLYICRKGPTGYRKTKRGHLVIDDLEGPVIAELFRRRLAGARVAELVEFLNDSEVQTESGVPFCDSRVYKILGNPAYKGTARSGRHVNTEAHEPLVSADDWQRCQSAPRKPKQWVESLLAGRIRCAACGGTMTSLRSNGARTRSNVYRCCASREACSRPAHARGEELDPLVEEFVFLHARSGRPPGSDLQSKVAQAAVRQAEEDLAKYRDNVALARTLGPERFEEGVAARVYVLERSLLDLARVKRARQGPQIDPRSLEREWPQLSWDQRRRAVAEAVDLVVVERGVAPVIERAWIFRKGRGPLVRAGERLQFRAPRPGTGRLHEHHLWERRRIEAELRKFFAGRERRWPAYLEFAKAGRGRLHAQVLEWGGPYFWAERLGIEVPACAVRWDERRLRGALRPFLAGRRRWPGKAEFREAGLGPLYDAVRYNGGFEHWAEQFDLRYAPRNGGRRVRWPKQRVERELREFLKGREVFPSKSDFRRGGKPRLYEALLSHGGIAYWARHFGVPTAAGARDRRREAERREVN